MEPDNNVPADADAKPPTPAARYDVGLIGVSVLGGFFVGIIFVLAYLGAIPSDIVLWFGAVILFGIAALFFLVRQRNARHTAALAQWAREGIHPSPASGVRVPVIYGSHELGGDEQEIAPKLALLAELFRGQRQIQIVKRFLGGHRNRGVYLIRSSAEAERVVKIARAADIRAEQSAQELINRFSQNNGGQFVRAVESEDENALGGVVYRLASLRRTAEISNFETHYRETRDIRALAALVEQLYSDVLPHSQFREMYTAAPFQEFAIPPRLVTKVQNALQNIPALSQLECDAEWLDLPHTTTPMRNPLYWAERVMSRFESLQMPMVRGVVHGDLHSGNLLIQQPGPNLWIIDFAKTRDHAPTLLDYARFEADLKFYLLDVQGDADLSEALRFEAQLLVPQRKTELDAPLSALENFADEFQKAGACLAALRRMAYSHRRRADDEVGGHFGNDSVLPYYLALFGFTLRSLTYEQCSVRQKTFALLAASMLAERITQLVT